jgi:branched-chain amino acid aminotransferase
MNVEERQIAVEELAEFDEVGACGTAAVISPVKRIYDADKNIEYLYGTEPGKVSVQLYEKLRRIQYGIDSDPYNWTEVI